MTDNNSNPTPSAFNVRRAAAEARAAAVVQPDQKRIDYVIGPVDPAYAQAEKILADTRLNNAAKTTDIRAVMEAAYADIEERLASETAVLTKQQAELRNKSRLSIVPTPEQAVQLEYTHAALNARWRNMQPNEMLADWQAAIDSGDTVTARVYRDFAHSHIEQRNRQGNKQGKPLAVGFSLAQIKELSARTDDMLSTPEQKKARADLAVVEVTLQALVMAASRAKSRVTGVRLDRDGKLIDGDRAALASRMRSMF